MLLTLVRAAQNVSREAKRRGVPHKKVHIVHFDWLEDSLMKGAAQDPHHYDLWHRLEAAAETERRKKANAAKKKAILKKGSKTFRKSSFPFRLLGASVPANFPLKLSGSL
jgi:hypothetical protein